MKKQIITISREYGSNGGAIAKRLAEKLGISCYDKEIIMLAAEQSNGGVGDMMANDERVTRPISMVPYPGTYASMSDKYFVAQQKVIRKLAAEGDCIFVGRCADDIVVDQECVRVFVYAPKHYKVNTIYHRYEMDSYREAERAVKRVNGNRRQYYEYYTGKKWGSIENYDLMLDSSKLSIDQVVDVIVAYAKARRDAVESGQN